MKDFVEVECSCMFIGVCIPNLKSYIQNSVLATLYPERSEKLKYCVIIQYLPFMK